MSYFPPFYPYPFPAPTTCGGFRAPITPEEYSKWVEPPYPAGHVITANTPTGPSNQVLENALSASEEAMVDNFVNHISGRNTGGGFLDNILRLNRGKLARVHMTFNSGANSSETKIFTGIIETAARDHLVLSDPTTGGRYLLLTIYLDYIEFPEEINYYYPGTNVLNIVDEKVLEENPEIMPLYHYKKDKKEQFIHKLEAIDAKLNK